MTPPENSSSYAIKRHQMVESQLRSRGIADERVLAAMCKVPRHQFLPERYQDQAYEDHPLPIGEAQTISQPYIVASMLEALKLVSSDKVLEIGAGSGYVTALLAELTAEVISVERYASLADSARAQIASLGYSNVRVVIGDGRLGLPESAPYDAIVVSAAASEIPRTLLDQLGDDGRMIIPVGAGETQQLQLICNHGGQLTTDLREMCRFVPLVSGAAD